MRIMYRYYYIHTQYSNYVSVLLYTHTVQYSYTCAVQCSYIHALQCSYYVKLSHSYLHIIIFYTLVPSHKLPLPFLPSNQRTSRKMPASRQARSATRHGTPYGLSNEQLDLLTLESTTARLFERCFQLKASKIRLRFRCLRRVINREIRIEMLERQLQHTQDLNRILAKAWKQLKLVTPKHGSRNCLRRQAELTDALEKFEDALQNCQRATIFPSLYHLLLYHLFHFLLHHLFHILMPNKGTFFRTSPLRPPPTHTVPFTKSTSPSDFQTMSFQLISTSTSGSVLNANCAQSQRRGCSRTFAPGGGGGEVHEQVQSLGGACCATTLK